MHKRETTGNHGKPRATTWNPACRGAATACGLRLLLGVQIFDPGGDGVLKSGREDRE